MLSFILDTHLPPSLSNFLKASFSVNCLHTTYFENGHLMRDSEIRSIATKEKFIVVTKDKDFADYFTLKGAPPRLLYLQTGNISNKNLKELFSKNFNSINTLFTEGADMIVMDINQIIIY